MWEIAEGAALLYLGTGAAIDVKRNRVPAGYLLAGSCAAVLYQVFAGNLQGSLWIGGMAVGAVFLAVSKWSHEGIGYGDSWMILNLGIFLGLWRLLVALLAAFLASSILAGIGVAAGKLQKKSRLPFFPFLLGGYVGAMLW